MAAKGLYEEVLRQLGEGEPVVRPPRIRASAAVVLWRRTQAAGLEVYWVQRAEELAFMGGWHAFPGGGLSRRDREIAVAGTPRGVDEGPADAGIPDLVRDGIALDPVVLPGLAACAVRELLEEVGIAPLVAADPSGLRERIAAVQERLLAKRQEPARLAADLGGEPDLSRLVYAGRWLTPPLGPVRFDNRFFLLEWSESEPIQPHVVPGELQSGEWVRPADAVARWRRGEILTAPPILHLLTVLAEEGPERGLARMRHPVEANLGAFRRVEFRPGVVLFPLATPTLPPAAYTNAYLLGFGDAVLVDPGSPFEREIEALLAALESAAEQGRRVREIWLTHHHPDHIGGVEKLRRALDLPVRAHLATADRLAEVGIEVDGTLEEGQRVVLAGDPPFPLRVVHTPGHARGHLCFYDETFGSLIAGDVVAGLGTIVIDPPEGDMGAYLETLARLRRLRPATLFPAHGPTVKNAAGLLSEYIDHRLERERQVLAAWRGGRTEPRQILPEVYPDLPAPARPLAERQIVAHLDRLRGAGRLEASSC